MTKCNHASFAVFAPMTDRTRCGHWLKWAKHSLAAASGAFMLADSSQWVPSRRKWRQRLSIGLRHGLEVGR